MIKKLTKIPEPKKLVPKEPQNGKGSSDKSKSVTISSKGGGASASLDPTNMIKSSGIMVEHANIPKPIF